MKPLKVIKRREMIKHLAKAGSGFFFLQVIPMSANGNEIQHWDQAEHLWGYAMDVGRCIGCCACMRGCQQENDVPDGYFRTWVERYRISSSGEVHVDAATEKGFVFEESQDGLDVAKAFFVPKMCNHCARSVCSQVCPVGATYDTPDGVVLVDPKHCVGCGYCIQACPYGTRFMLPKEHTASKCTLCYHRISKGQNPACVQVCPRGVRIFGDLKDPKSRLSELMRQRSYRVLKPEMGTHPKVYYFGLSREVV